MFTVKSVGLSSKVNQTLRKQRIITTQNRPKHSISTLFSGQRSTDFEIKTAKSCLYRVRIKFPTNIKP